MVVCDGVCCDLGPPHMRDYPLFPERDDRWSRLLAEPILHPHRISDV